MISSIEAGRINYLPDGTKVTLKTFTSSSQASVSVSDVSEHESIHAFLAVERNAGLKKVSINPGVDYLGITEVSQPDAVVAIGPHAVGKSGTGHDQAVAFTLGDPGAQATAASMVSANRVEIHAIAVELDQKKTLDGNDVRRIIKGIREPKPIEGSIHIVRPDGLVEDKAVTVTNNVVTINEGTWSYV